MKSLAVLVKNLEISTSTTIFRKDLLEFCKCITSLLDL